MKKHLMGFVALSLFFLGCEDEQQEIAANIPNETIGYLQLNSPEKLVQDLEQMISDMGLQGLLRGQSLLELVDTALAEEDMGFTSEIFDFTKPLAMAFLAPEDEFSEMPLGRIFLPSTDPEGFLEALGQTNAGNVTQYGFTTESYLIFDNGNISSESGDYDFSQLPDLMKGTLSYYVGLKELLEVTGVVMEDIYSGRDQAIESMETAPLTDLQKEQFASLMNTGVQFLEDLRGLWGSLSITPEVWGGVMNLGFAPKSESMELIRKIESPDNAKDMLKYLPADAFINFANATNSQTVLELNEYLSELLTAIPGGVVMSSYFEQLREFNELLGDKSAGSVDLTLSPSFMEIVSGSADISALLEEISAQMYFVTEIKDDARFTQYLEEVFASDLIPTIVEGLKDSAMYQSGLIPEIDFSMEMVDNPLNLPFTNKELVIDFRLLEDEYIDDRTTANALIEELIQKFPIHIGIEDGLMVMTVGDPSKIIEILQEGEIQGQSLADLESFQAVLEYAPDKLAAVGNLSFGPLIELSNLSSGGFLQLPSTQGRYPGLVGYTSFGENSVALGAYIAFEELATIMRPIAPILLMSMQAF
jgi:hypothetical protein